MSEKYGKDMHYPSSSLSTKQLKLFATNAQTPEERAQYTRDIRKPHGKHNAPGKKRA